MVQGIIGGTRSGPKYDLFLVPESSHAARGTRSSTVRTPREPFFCSDKIKVAGSRRGRSFPFPGSQGKGKQTASQKRSKSAQNGTNPACPVSGSKLQLLLPNKNVSEYRQWTCNQKGLCVCVGPGQANPSQRVAEVPRQSSAASWHGMALERGKGRGAALLGPKILENIVVGCTPGRARRCPTRPGDRTPQDTGAEDMDWHRR